MSDPLRIVFEVACRIRPRLRDLDRRIGTWWPADHTISGDPRRGRPRGSGRRTHLRAHATRRRAGLGRGHSLAPARPAVGYRWHLGVGPEAATDVDGQVLTLDERTTRVEIVQSGWERLGESGPSFRGATRRVGIAGAARQSGNGKGRMTWRRERRTIRGCSRRRRDPRSTDVSGRNGGSAAVGLPGWVHQVDLSVSERLTICMRGSRRRRTGCPSEPPTNRRWRAEGTVEAWGRSPDNPVGGWYGLRKGYRGRFGMYLPPLLEELGLAEVTHDARNNKMRAK